MAPHRVPVWAIREGCYVEMYDRHPFEADAVRIADFRTEDFIKHFRLTLAERTPYMVRVWGEIARNK